MLTPSLLPPVVPGPFSIYMVLYTQACPMDKDLDDALDICNLIFVGIFAIEAAIKVRHTPYIQ